MFTENRDNKYIVKTGAYEAVISEECIDFIVGGVAVAGLRPVSAVHTCGEGDAVNEDAENAGVTLTATKENGVPTYVWTSASSNWEKKEYIVRCFEEHFEYSVRLTGKGAVDTVNYFSGDLASKNPGSNYEFDTGFTPIVTVNGQSQCTFSAAQENMNEFSYLMIPPMFVYAFTVKGVQDKVAFGLVAEKGEHNFTQFNYRTKYDAHRRNFWFWTDQSGHTVVDGTWETPRVLCYPAESDMDSLKFYSDYYYSHKIAKMKSASEYKPRFWYGPMACGWVEQDAYGRNYGDAWGACEKIYNHFVAQMERVDLHPQILIIDDKWQETYGDQYPNVNMFPDLRGFIDGMLENHNIHTMLWFKLWDSEGIPEDMCMYDPQNKTKVVDPTNPKFRAKLKEMLYKLLSSDEGCCNAWGLKLDYAFFQPVGREAKSYDGRYGVELFLEYIKYIYECVKEIKPEAIVNASPMHPLFAQYVDHARLHDYHFDLRRCYEEFIFRGECYKIAMPNALVDTDGAGFSSHRDTMRWMRFAHKIGIPDLYCFDNMPSINITDEDWAVVAANWKAYSDKIDTMFE